MTKTMIKKFKSWIIHRLGGVTINEIEQKDSNSFDMGTYVTLESLRDYARSLNGLSADEWCRRMYAHIDDSIKQLNGEEGIND